MPSPEYIPARTWTHEKRKGAAMEKVLDGNWTQRRAVGWYGIDRKAFARALKQERLRRGLPPTKREEDAIAKEKARQQAHKLAAAEVGQRGNETGVLNQHLDPDFVRRPDFVSQRRVPPPDEFDRMYFGHFICPDCDEHHPSPEFHSEISEICQDDGVRRGLILTPPYHAKTTRATVRDTVYDIAKNPNSRTLIISETRDFAQNILGGIKALLSQHEMYVGAERNLIEDWGPFYEPGQTWNKESVVVTGRQSAEIDPTVQVIGYRGQIYGRRAEKIKSDDIASYHNQANPDQVTSMLEWFDGQVLSRIGKNARMIWIGTRVRPGDIYETLLDRYSGEDNPQHRVMRYSAIMDETSREMLWPEHFPWEFAVTRRSEMDPAMWQLVYQNVRVLTAGTTFPHEGIEKAKNVERRPGEYDSGHFLVAGLDPAGAGTDSGYTAFVLMAVDPYTNKFSVVDAYRQKQMKAPEIKAKMLEWSDLYKPYEWRVEVNGIQRQLLQYNEDIVVPLAARGIPIRGHVTNQNKWDEQFGIESMVPLFINGLIDIPWMSQGNEHIKSLVDELRHFPLAPITDLLMAMWFSVIGCREITNRSTMPLFDSKTKRWPKRIRERRHLVNFSTGDVDMVPVHAQNSKVWEGMRRHTSGVPTMYPDVLAAAEEVAAPDMVPFVNKEGYVNATPD